MSNETLTSKVRQQVIADLADGSLRPGEPLSVKKLSERLKISHTPVREGLERLVGEGVIRLAGARHGFVAPWLGAKQLADLHELAGVVIEAMLGRITGDVALPALPEELALAQPWRAVGDTLEEIATRADNGFLAAELRRIATQLVAYRRHEPQLVPHWLDTLDGLRSQLGSPSRARAAARHFTKTRMSASARIVEAHDIDRPYANM